MVLLIRYQDKCATIARQLTGNGSHSEKIRSSGLLYQCSVAPCVTSEARNKHYNTSFIVCSNYARRQGALTDRSHWVLHEYVQLWFWGCISHLQQTTLVSSCFGYSSCWTLLYECYSVMQHPSNSTSTHSYNNNFGASIYRAYLSFLRQQTNYLKGTKNCDDSMSFNFTFLVIDVYSRPSLTI